MADIRPFSCIRPKEELALRVAALPYDVYTKEEAMIEVEREPFSFLKVDLPEINFAYEVDPYDELVYTKARELFDKMMSDEVLFWDREEGYYIYELTMNQRSQTGIVACASIDDYVNNIIKKHENTRKEKELDRINHVKACNAQTGPIFLAYPANQIIRNIVKEIKKEEPVYSFTTNDEIKHTVWKVRDTSREEEIRACFKTMNRIYIADGHHRAASAVNVGLVMREQAGYEKNEPYNYFLSVLFPEDELMIMPYNRVVMDLNGYSKEEYLQKISEYFDIDELSKEDDITSAGILSNNPKIENEQNILSAFSLVRVNETCNDGYKPDKKAIFGMYLDKKWYRLSAKEKLLSIDDAVKSLDVSLLQDYILGPILGIEDPRTDKRIDFVGGIRGEKELEKRVNEGMGVAFSLYPTSVNELFRVSDESKLMPPKSTWFEPKLRSGLFIHKLSK